MLENTWYSVISPESCSSILWRSWDFKQEAAESLKLTAQDMFDNKLIDNIIEEPEGGAQYNPKEVFSKVKKIILDDINELNKIDSSKRIKLRVNKFQEMGVFNER
jgi:acetyl-CoA carboxylase carboxyl transferase subunit alpha